ncbi:mediator of RNA polymerase II transcription subunit 29 [Ischnura elegans]|uniref:mediator of RNA polymerase II transcription subunit 29 n=1 Tax=Ischnura elegans TaxID=197161 RepID=UPI001ED86DC3|nr:mediator of RNA polymerase II transcription subunit 29 [Ischnura elegans]
MNIQAQQQQPGTPQQQGQPPQQQMPQQQERLDNISKVKSLMPALKESLMAVFKTAAQTFHQNSLVDIGSLKGVDVPLPRFDKNIEEFYSICDQIELHLKTSIACVSQGGSSQRYLPLPVALTRTEASPSVVNPTPASPQVAAAGTNQGGDPSGGGASVLTYSQFLATVRAQVSYAREIHHELVAAAQNVASGD